MSDVTKSIKKLPNSAADSNRLWIPAHDYALNSNQAEYKDDECFFVPAGAAELAADSKAFNRH